MRTSNYRKFKITKKQAKLVGGAAAVAVLAGIIFFFAFFFSVIVITAFPAFFAVIRSNSFINSRFHTFSAKSSESFY